MNARLMVHYNSRELLKVLRPQPIVPQLEGQTIIIARRLESTTAAVFNLEGATQHAQAPTELAQVSQDLRIACVPKAARDS